ncbi:putative C-type lectin domain family 20 member A [Eucyclogobius newberryi]|uniref:putative C-type lectin domain family 20 member A n=1 Tax=Eucyclogobius newberryi TaxID=166745 RepID=UPI003B5A391E
MEAGILFILSILIHFARTGREFVVVDQYLDWTQAQTYCRDKYTDLVTVHNQQDNQKLMAVAANNLDCIWIGLRHKLHTWRWSMGVPSLSYDEKDDIWADEHANEKYLLVEQLKTWSEAQAYCRTHHDDLASVTSEAVLLDLEAMLTSAGVYWAWTGLYRDPWSTWSDSTNTSFDNWGTRPTIYPTDDHCGCLKPDTGKWEERYCTAGCKFFCYGGKIMPFLNASTLCEALRVSGRAFQSRGATAWKALSPMVESLALGWCRRWVDMVERRVLGAVCGVRSSLR